MPEERIQSIRSTKRKLQGRKQIVKETAWEYKPFF